MNELLKKSPVVPLIQADDPAVAIEICHALAKGGLKVAEVVFRTERALECLKAVSDEVPDMVAGAGTVLTAAQAQAAIDNGAKFIVSPGLDDAVVALSQEQNIPIYPGTMTPTEVQRAVNLGLDTVKFFPASIAGGVPALKALSSVFGSMQFMPTGGVSPGNLVDFLSIPAVIACGGSWLTPADAIKAGDYEQLTTLAKEALEIAATVRG